MLAACIPLVGSWHAYALNPMGWSFKFSAAYAAPLHWLTTWLLRQAFAMCHSTVIDVLLELVVKVDILFAFVILICSFVSSVHFSFSFLICFFVYVFLV